MNPESKKVFVMLRCSTSAQDLDRQKTDVERMRQTHALQIEYALPLEDVSGREVLQHPDVLRALGDLKRPDIAGGLVPALDRLFRPDDFEDFRILDFFRRSKKLIFSAKEGVIDPSTDIGFQICLMSGAMAGMEWRTLRQRTLDGKRDKRKLGRNVTGSESLPDGLLYRRVTNAAGKTIDGIWSYDEEKVAKIREAYRILFSDNKISLSALARRVGWSSDVSLRRSLQNPVWRGVRISAPMAGETEPVEIRLPLKPVLSDADWALAQVLIRKRRTWSKETADPRFLGAGLLVCACGEPFYFHSDGRRATYETYFCRSKFRKGPGCGAARLKRGPVDAALVQIVEENLMDAKFLSAFFRRIQETPRPDTRIEREKELTKLAGRRKRWLDAYDEEKISKAEFDERMDKVNAAMREIEAKMPSAPPPPFDTQTVVEGLVETFESFRTWQFADQRATLKRVVRSIPVRDEMIAEVVLSGHFLGQLAHTNLLQPS
jgi:DNA invertase Pin-like site-specific DNA recombinase